MSVRFQSRSVLFSKQSDDSGLAGESCELGRKDSVRMVAVRLAAGCLNLGKQAASELERTNFWS